MTGLSSIGLARILLAAFLVGMGAKNPLVSRYALMPPLPEVKSLQFFRTMILPPFENDLCLRPLCKD
jgi:hypothetical protein